MTAELIDVGLAYTDHWVQGRKSNSGHSEVELHLVPDFFLCRNTLPDREVAQPEIFGGCFILPQEKR